ncbi:MAG: hypothetical protein MZV70_59695 [Desulfobacterales bacterium]|nr:hypothetical protein [Desulfobacterales bacterium]
MRDGSIELVVKFKRAWRIPSVSVPHPYPSRRSSNTRSIRRPGVSGQSRAQSSSSSNST